MEETSDSSAIDRISDLPDPLIHHILSFLPSTKDSIRTSILSKRWKNQWAYVPVLIFKSSSGMSSDDDDDDYDDVDFARFIDSTLLQYECSKMKKFDIAYRFGTDANFDSKLLFAITKDVEVLCLVCSGYNDSYRLPNFIFDNTSLVELQIFDCDFGLSCRINWPSLKALKICNYCIFRDMLSINNVISGCPSLESLELRSLSFYFEGVFIIASKSLKKLILTQIEVLDHIEISCPNLEELIFKYFTFEQCKLVNLPSSCCATLDYIYMSTYCASPSELITCSEILAKKTLEELQAFKEVTFGDWFVEILSAIEMRHPYYPLLNVKCLTLNRPFFEHIVGIVNALRWSPALERLVIKLYAFDQHPETEDLDLNNFEEAYLDSNVTDFTCFVSNLKTVKIVGLSNHKNSKCKAVLQFVKFLLKNAKALEKMVVILKDCGTDFQVKVCRKLLSFPRVSQHAIVDLM